MAAAPVSSIITVPAVSRRFHILTWLLVVLLIGGHWCMIQVVAWTGMLIDFSQDKSFVAAVEMTFDGGHPCAICKQVDRGIATDLGTDERKAPGKLNKMLKLDAEATTPVVSLPALVATIVPWIRLIDVPTGTDLEPPRRPPR